MAAYESARLHEVTALPLRTMASPLEDLDDELDTLLDSWTQTLLTNWPTWTCSSPNPRIW